MCSHDQEVLVVPKNGQGHLLPCMELCKQLIHRYDCNISVIVESTTDISSSIPYSLRHNHRFHLVQMEDESSTASSDSHHSPQPHFLRENQRLSQGIESVITRPGSTRPVCAIVDHIMNKTQIQEACARFGVPIVTFITSSACWAAVQHAAWVVQPSDMKPGEVRDLPGLPQGMVLSYSDLKQKGHWRPSPPPTQGGGGNPPRMMRGPPLPGQPAPWVEEVKSCAAILFNTCDDIDRPFLDYVANLTGKPVWGVGPLLPNQYWKSLVSLLQERDIRPKRESNYTDEEIIAWLDQQLHRSVMFVSFGSEVSPSAEEYPELANALEESRHPFIWVIQRKSGPGMGMGQIAVEYFPHGLDTKVGKRGLIIHGWSPQLLILSHPSIGGFLTHCGWNSTVEAIVRGIPLLAWPIRGDQYYNAKLVVSYLKIGAMIAKDYPEAAVRKADVLDGIEKVLKDGDIRKRSLEVMEKFQKGFPESSAASLDAFMKFILGGKATA